MRQLSLWLSAFLLMPLLALGQAIPNGGPVTQGEVWTVEQWNNAWGAKVDVDNGILNNPTISGAALQNPVFLPGFFLTVSAGGSGTNSLSGVLKGNGTSAFSSAVFTDITNLWTTSGVCNSSTFLRGDGACVTTATNWTGTPAIPPAIGGTTPAAGAFTTLSVSGNFTTNVTGSTQCLHVNSSGVVSGVGADCGSGGGGGAFSGVTSGTNTSASMLVGTGAGLSTTGTGYIVATSLSNTLAIASGGTGATTLALANIPVQTGAITNGHCVSWASATSIQDAGAGCSASPTFAQVTTGTNATALTIGTGGSLAVSGTGTIAATSSSSLTALTGMPSQLAGTVLANVTGSPGVPTAVTLSALQAALTATNAQLVTDSPAAGPTNDYNASGNLNSSTAILYLTPASGGTTLNGMAAGSAMQQLFIVNAEAAGGADLIKLANQSASDSTAANRFLTSATVSLAIPPGGGVGCIYLASTVSRWWCH